MAEPTVFEGQTILVKIGDGASPEIFAHPCLINLTRSLSISANMVEEEVFDCDTPDDPATIYRLKRSISLQVTGTGKMDITALSEYLAWSLDADAKNARIDIGGTSGRRLSCAVQLSEFAIEGEPKNYATVNLTLMSTGDISEGAVS